MYSHYHKYRHRVVSFAREGEVFLGRNIYIINPTAAKDEEGEGEEEIKKKYSKLKLIYASIFNKCNTDCKV